MLMRARTKPGFMRNRTPKHLRTHVRIAILLCTIVAVAAPGGFSQAVEETAAVPCPDGSDALCAPPGFFADEGELSNGHWIVSIGCIEYR